VTSAAGPEQAPSAPTGTLLGVKLSVVELSDVLAQVTRAIETRTSISVTFLNPTYLMAAHRDAGLRELINRFDLVLADGWGVVHGARFLGVPVATRLANDDIGPDLFHLSQEKGWRTYLFGSAPGVAERAGARLAQVLPGLPIVGTRHGWWDALRGHPGRFDPQDAVAAVDAINATHPDVLWVGLPTPLQQRWVTSYRDRLDVPVVITGGAYLDHLVEGLVYYPGWAVRLHLCWLYKLALEPRRLWRRYTVEMAHYGMLLLRERVTASQRRAARR
jgi:N-acetylglucosaminyldiphosphoundecaprenol N-acetyl-beta-D-mannosaminyltransferase